MSAFCSFCEGEGDIYRARIKLTGEVIFICDECDTVWFNKDIIETEATSFEKVMLDRGLRPLWSELEDLELL